MDLAFNKVDAKGKAAIGSDAQAPRSFAISRQCMNLPRWQRTQFFRIVYLIQKSKLFAELIYSLRRNALRIVFLVELFQTLVDETLYFHLIVL